MIYRVAPYNSKSRISDSIVSRTFASDADPQKIPSVVRNSTYDSSESYRFFQNAMRLSRCPGGALGTGRWEEGAGGMGPDGPPCGL